MFHRSSVRIALVACLIITSRSYAAADATLIELKLTAQNYAVWRDYVLPDQSDLGWQQIPWLTTFQQGILSANERNRPLLFWTMNGHPLGCT